MKTLGGLIVLYFLIFPVCVHAQFLKADGKIIVDGNGNEVILRGMGLGGWMLQEGYMLQLSSVANPQHEIKALIEETIGTQNTETFYDAWLNNHCRKIDIDSLAAWGFNSVRLPMHYNLYTLPIEDEPVAGEHTWIEKGFAMTDSLLNWCAENEIYLILDLHAAPGGQGHDAAISDYDETKPSLWESEANKQKTIALWRKLADRYKDHPWIGGYDLINETNWGFEDPNDKHGNSEQGNVPLRELLVNITNAIREVDTNHIIYIEGNSWANNYNGIFPPWDDNMVASFHKYWTVNDVESIQWMLAFREQYDIPLWLGESGENSNTWYQDAISICERNHIGWAWWPLKKVGLNNILEIKKTQGYQDLIDYWEGKAGKPSESVAFESMMELAENVKLENCVFHPDVVDAMIRLPHSSDALPFKEHKIVDEYRMFVVDYDFGGNEVGYFDQVVANYHVSSGSYTAWNLGWSYRNDGVDIDICQDDVTNGYALGWTEPGEWLQYTVQVEESGIFDISVKSASAVDQNKLGLNINGLQVIDPVTLPNTGGWQNWESTTINDIFLAKGQNVIRLEIIEGEYNLNYLEFAGPNTSESVQPLLTDATINSEDYTQIIMAYNQPFKEIESSEGYTVAVNGANYEIDSVYLMEGQPQVILIKLKTAIIYGDEAFITYSGTSVTTSNDVVLEAFSQIPLSIEIPNPLDANFIPGVIESEHMSVNNGFRADVCYDEGGGLYIGWTDPNDYLVYDVEVLETGTYQVAYRHAGQGGTGKISVYQVTEGNDVLLESIEFNSTLGWQNWSSKVGAEFDLEKGKTQLKVQVINANFNLNHFDFQLLSVPSESDFRFIRGYTNPSGDKVFLELNKEVLESSLALDGFQIKVDGETVQFSDIGLQDARTLVLDVSEAIGEEVIIKVTYDENGKIVSSDSKPLNTFSNALIKNEVVFLNFIEIPGKIEVEDFSVNSGFEFEDCTDTGGGKNAGYTDEGDYLDFEVNVTEEGRYKVSYRVASESAGGDLSLLKVDNGKATSLSQVSFSATGGWQNWTTVDDEATLEAGPQVLRLMANASLFNINWVELKKMSDNVTGFEDDIMGSLIYPNPSRNEFRIKGVKDQVSNNIQIHSISGKRFEYENKHSYGEELMISHRLPSGLYLVSWKEGELSRTQKLIVHRD